MYKKISVIIPTFNEDKCILNCLYSLSRQVVKPYEIIVVDDGSEDNTVPKVRNYINFSNKKIKLLLQKHQGPGTARNLGGFSALGQILVFIDADMVLDINFLKILTSPISNGEAVVTNSREERLANPEDYWAICWNIGRFASAGVFTNRYRESMIPNPENFGTIYRAITTNIFKRIGGYATGGDYNDDESLHLKLGIRAKIVPAVFYHRNPTTLKEVWNRAYWIGSSQSFIKRKVVALQIISFLPISSIIKGIIIAIRFRYIQFIAFKIIYDLAVLTALLTKK